MFKRGAAGARLLALRRSKGRKLAGIWQPVTGGVKRGESIFAAATREVREETGLIPIRWWLLEPPLLHFTRPGGELRLLPRFAAEVASRSVVKLSAEHDAHAFLWFAAAAKRFLWESQREGAKRIVQDVLRGGALADALEVPRGKFRPGSTSRRIRG